MSSYEISLKDNYEQEIINERLYRNFLKYDDVIDEIEYFEDEQKYIIHTKNSYRSKNKDKIIGKHFKINTRKKYFYRYNYFDFKINDFLRNNFIKSRMPILYNFITDQNIKKIIVRSKDSIKTGFYKNVVSDYIFNLLEESCYYNTIINNIIDTVIILGLIKKLDNDELKEKYYDISINNNFMSNLIRMFEKQDITLYTIDNIIDKKLYEIKHLSELTVFNNKMFTDHNYKFYKDLYELKFIYTFQDLIANIVKYN